LATTSYAQEDIIPQKYDVFQGGELPFQINCPFGYPTISDPMEGNIVDYIQQIGNDFYFKYIPDPDFLGKDGFQVEVIVNPFPTPQTLTYDFEINVIASVIKTNDDFIHLTTQDEIIIDILSNDETSSSNLNVNLAHVLKGTATVNEDLTISYTPVDDSPDYIVYSVSDDFNTISSSTIYISQQADLEEELTVKEYKIASGNSQIIILPSEDLTLSVESYENGTVEQINSFVYEYHSDINLEGYENVNFVDADGNIYQASITIIEKYTDDGFVIDDIFYSASNTNIVL